jgi:hypothetical protein
MRRWSAAARLAIASHRLWLLTPARMSLAVMDAMIFSVLRTLGADLPNPGRRERELGPRPGAVAERAGFIDSCGVRLKIDACHVDERQQRQGALGDRFRR